MSVIIAQSPTSSGAPPSGSSATLITERVVGFPALPAPLAPNSVAIGAGAQTEETATQSVAVGDQSLARHVGAAVFANGSFGSPGDVQEGKYLLRTQTVTSEYTEAFLDGTLGSLRLIIPDDSTWTFTATITAHRTDDRGHAGFKVDGVVYRNSGQATIAFQGNPIKTIVATSDPTWDINIDVDPSSGSLVAFAKGQAGQTIRWAVLITTLEVTN